MLVSKNQYNVFFMLSQRFSRHPLVGSQPEFGMALRNLHGFPVRNRMTVSVRGFSQSAVFVLFRSANARDAPSCLLHRLADFREFTGTGKRGVDYLPT